MALAMLVDGDLMSPRRISAAVGIAVAAATTGHLFMFGFPSGQVWR
jgi:hypothetical protein